MKVDMLVLEIQGPIRSRIIGGHTQARTTSLYIC